MKMSYPTDDFEDFESKMSLNSGSNWMWPYPAPGESNNSVL